MLTRFAPSPTGYLHLGHALAAKEAFDFGPCLLRIEDIDHTRCKAEFTDAIYKDLAWLGFTWPQPVRVQSRHYSNYLDVIKTLLERGLAYPCNLTRGDLKNGRRPEPREMIAEDWQAFNTAYSSATPSLPFAIRLNLEDALKKMSDYSLIFEDNTSDDGEIMRNAEVELRRWMDDRHRDPIIGRKDIGVSYHIAVTYDDAAQNITHIVRGMDLYDETPLHVLIQKLMGWPTPVYHHHALLRRPDGKKLSKRSGDTAISALREKGLTAQEVLDMAKP